MQKYSTLFFIAILVFLAACAAIPKATQGRLLWEENFNWKGKGIDQSRWSKIPRGLSDWNRHMSDFDSLFDFRNGRLVLRGINNTTLSGDTAPFLTGGIFTRGKVAFGTGRWEVHAKLNPAQGAWPAFWLLPENAPWPTGGEIDIMERLNFDTFAYQTVHSYYTQVLEMRNEPKNHSTGPINPDGFNTYAVEIHPDSLVFFINNTKSFSYPRIQAAKEGQWPFSDHKYYLLLDMQLGGSWVGKVNREHLPVEMEIDWVRFYALPETKK